MPSISSWEYSYNLYPGIQVKCVFNLFCKGRRSAKYHDKEQENSKGFLYSHFNPPVSVDQPLFTAEPELKRSGSG